jgi:molybdopterin/thiamine biosynthesis adenylyltransferase
MKYSYAIIDGKEIKFEKLRLARARKIALAVLHHPYCINDSVGFILRSDGAEIILLTFDNEIPENPQNGVKAFEDVAIICNESDTCHPEVYALREDFVGGLSHTNVCLFEHPVSLCVTEQIFEEVRHRFNEFEFIELIRTWFTLTSEGRLHQEDQPLESFFQSSGYIVAPQNLPPQIFNFLQKVGDMELYYLSKEPTGEAPFSIIRFPADAQVHGFIRKEPTKLSDLDEVVKLSGVTFSESVKVALDMLLSEYSYKNAFYTHSIAFYCEIPVLRNPEETKPSTNQHLCFITNKNFTDIGLESKCIGEVDSNFSCIVSNKFNIDVIKNLVIKTYTPLLDFSPSTAALFNNSEQIQKNFMLIGAGALGSQVLSAFSRLGFGKWTVVDHDFLLPHNLAKHALGRKSIGLHKASKISEEVNELLGSEFATPVSKNFFEFVDDEGFVEKVSKFDMIIDMSTSIAVARKLARDLDVESEKPRISAFLNPIGTDLVILSEDKAREHRLDLLEMQYYRCLFDEEDLHNHLQITQKDKVRYNRNSCREVTNKINQTDVAIHASICSKVLKQIINTGDSRIAIWNIDKETHEVKRYSFEPSNWVIMKVDEWEICIDDWLIQKIRKFRLSALPKETGGILLGSIDTERKILYLIDTIFAPQDSIEEQTSFIRGTEGLIEKYEQYQMITDNQVIYLGEWHSHPENCSTNPSQLDETLFGFLAKTLCRQGYPAVMCILGDDNINVYISFSDERIN